MPQLTACPSCAEHLDPADRFCGNCGAPLPPDGPPPGDPDRTDGAGTDLAAAASGQAASGQAASGIAADGADPDATWPGSGPVPTGSFTLAPPAPAAVPAPAGPMPVTVPVSASEAESSPVPPAGPHTGAVDPRQGLIDDPDTEPQEHPRGDCTACGAGRIDDDGYCVRCGHGAPRSRDHVEHELPCVAAVSDRGLRHQRNEDAFAVAEAERPDGTRAVIAVVCDGVSSATRPDEASAAASQAGGARLANDMADGADPARSMHEALLVAAAAVNALTPPQAVQDPHFNAPACTCVSAVLTGDLLTVGWIGDSRAYWIPDEGEPARLTLDDSWAARMVEAGLMSEADAFADPRAHAITGWLGADAEELDPHTASFTLDTPGVVVVCTDGLWNYAESAAELAAVVPDDARTEPLGAARRLVKFALDGGGHDNVTVAVLPFPVTDGGPAGAGGNRR